MSKFSFILILIWPIVWLGNCKPCKRRIEAISKVNKTTGEVIATDHLIQKYEKEHQKLYGEEIGVEDHLGWPALDSKVLSHYCKQLLQYSVPRKKSDNATSLKLIQVLQYMKENTSITNPIVIVICKIMNFHPLSYYITRAPEPNCVYSMNYTNKLSKRVLRIINKYCDFEEKSLKWERLEMVDKVHKPTGQPMAKDEYLLAYEIEHQQLLRREKVNGQSIEWLHGMLHDNLNSYCYQYLEKCAPSRNHEGVTGCWKNDILNYQKIDSSGDIEVTIIVCRPHNTFKRNYYMTRALERNCVYALFRNGLNAYSPLVIGFKHCNFDETNVKQAINNHTFYHNKNIILQTEVKEESSDKLETLQLFPQH